MRVLANGNVDRSDIATAAECTTHDNWLENKDVRDAGGKNLALVVPTGSKFRDKGEVDHAAATSIAGVRTDFGHGSIASITWHTAELFLEKVHLPTVWYAEPGGAPPAWEIRGLVRSHQDVSADFVRQILDHHMELKAGLVTPLLTDAETATFVKLHAAATTRTAGAKKKLVDFRREFMSLLCTSADQKTRVYMIVDGAHRFAIKVTQATDDSAGYNKNPYSSHIIMPDMSFLIFNVLAEGMNDKGNNLCNDTPYVQKLATVQGHVARGLSHIDVNRMLAKAWGGRQTVMNIHKIVLWLDAAEEEHGAVWKVIMADRTRANPVWLQALFLIPEVALLSPRGLHQYVMFGNQALEPYLHDAAFAAGGKRPLNHLHIPGMSGYKWVWNAVSVSVLTVLLLVVDVVYASLNGERHHSHGQFNKRKKTLSWAAKLLKAAKNATPLPKSTGSAEEEPAEGEAPPTSTGSKRKPERAGKPATPAKKAKPSAATSSGTPAKTAKHSDATSSSSGAAPTEEEEPSLTVMGVIAKERESMLSFDQHKATFAWALALALNAANGLEKLTHHPKKKHWLTQDFIPAVEKLLEEGLCPVSPWEKVRAALSHANLAQMEVGDALTPLPSSARLLVHRVTGQSGSTGIPALQEAFAGSDDSTSTGFTDWVGGDSLRRIIVVLDIPDMHDGLTHDGLANLCRDVHRFVRPSPVGSTHVPSVIFLARCTPAWLAMQEEFEESVLAQVQKQKPGSSAVDDRPVLPHPIFSLKPSFQHVQNVGVVARDACAHSDPVGDAAIDNADTGEVRLFFNNLEQWAIYARPEDYNAAHPYHPLDRVHSDGDLATEEASAMCLEYVPGPVPGHTARLLSAQFHVVAVCCVVMCICVSGILTPLCSTSGTMPYWEGGTPCPCRGRRQTPRQGSHRSLPSEPSPVGDPGPSLQAGGTDCRVPGQHNNAKNHNSQITAKTCYNAKLSTS